jgi:hypothetical protein
MGGFLQASCCHYPIALCCSYTIALYVYSPITLYQFYLIVSRKDSVPSTWKCGPAPRRKWLVSLFSIIGDCENSAECYFRPLKKVDVTHAWATTSSVRLRCNHETQLCSPRVSCLAGRDRSTRGRTQKLMRHAHVSTTMDQYGNASALAKRKANRPIVQRLLKRPANQEVSIQ